MWLISVEKDRKHVLTQKVVILNTCCDIACLTFQLPHITTGSFQSHRWQPTTGSLQSLRFKDATNLQSEKSFAFHNLLCWHFQVAWASVLQYVWIILLKIFWISQGKATSSDRWCGQICKIFDVKFSQDLTHQKSAKLVIFWQSYLKIKRWIFFGTPCILYSLCSIYLH